MKNLIPLLLALAFLQSSCEAPMYIPSALPVAFHDKSGQVEVRAGIRNAYVSASFLKHFAVRAMGHRGNYDWAGIRLYSDGDPSAGGTSSIYTGSVGLEYFTKIHTQRSLAMMPHVMMGAGFGKLQYSYSATWGGDYYSRKHMDYDLKARTRSVFLMSGVTLHFFRMLMLDVSVRYIAVSYSPQDYLIRNYDAWVQEYHRNSDFNKGSNGGEFRLPIDFRDGESRTYHFLEPAATLRFMPWKWIFVQTQAGFSQCITQKDFDGRQISLEFSLGFRANNVVGLFRKEK